MDEITIQMVFLLLSILFGSEVYLHYRIGKLESDLKWVKTLLLNIVNNDNGDK
ncbi:MAG: hypothetical protein QXK24_06895 [Ignisphaera sp.]